MSDTVELLGVRIDALTMDQAVARLLEWLGEPRTTCRYVVTPNTDHVVLLNQLENFRHAYAEASMTLADGFPLVWASRLLRRPIPERVAGSDLVPALFTEASRRALLGGRAPLRVFLLGAEPGVADRAAEEITRRWPGVVVVGTHSPPRDFEFNFQRNRQAVELVSQAEPNVLIVGLGAPKQELWVHSYRRELRTQIAICAGATIDFLAGYRKRAPGWMQRRGLEWLYRLMQEPRRLFPRYYKDALALPLLFIRELWPMRPSRGAPA